MRGSLSIPWTSIDSPKCVLERRWNIFLFSGENTVYVYWKSNPELETKSILDIKDTNGKAFMREFIETAKNKGSGWVDYMWPRPGQKNPARKMSYIKRAKLPSGEAVLVGAGIYVK